jgi:hypothetical protein
VAFLFGKRSEQNVINPFFKKLNKIKGDTQFST